MTARVLRAILVATVGLGLAGQPTAASAAKNGGGGSSHGGSSHQNNGGGNNSRQNSGWGNQGNRQNNGWGNQNNNEGSNDSRRNQGQTATQRGNQQFQGQSGNLQNGQTVQQRNVQGNQQSANQSQQAAAVHAPQRIQTVQTQHVQTQNTQQATNAGKFVKSATPTRIDGTQSSQDNHVSQSSQSSHPAANAAVESARQTAIIHAAQAQAAARLAQQTSPPNEITSVKANAQRAALLAAVNRQALQAKLANNGGTPLNNSNASVKAAAQHAALLAAVNRQALQAKLANTASTSPASTQGRTGNRLTMKPLTTMTPATLAHGQTTALRNQPADKRVAYQQAINNNMAARDAARRPTSLASTQSSDGKITAGKVVPKSSDRTSSGPGGTINNKGPIGVPMGKNSLITQLENTKDPGIASLGQSMAAGENAPVTLGGIQAANNLLKSPGVSQADKTAIQNYLTNNTTLNHTSPIGGGQNGTGTAGAGNPPTGAGGGIITNTVVTSTTIPSNNPGANKPFNPVVGLVSGIIGGIGQMLDAQGAAASGVPDCCNGGGACFVADDDGGGGCFMSVDQGPPEECLPVDGGGPAQYVQADETSPDQTMTVTEGAQDAGGVAAAGATEEASSPPTVPATAVPQHTRYLRVANAGKEKATLYVSYYTEDSNHQWKWFPAAPDANKPGDEALAVELAPGEPADLTDNGWQINASKIRIWGKSADGREWNKFKDQDLLLVPETDANGDNLYAASEKQTFSFTVK